jgi:ligand-binding sensor domain-containing protein/signal transduction histidine kinase/DNA-binding response OmpR family regulator
MLTLILFVHHNLFAGQYYFRHFRNEEGLSHNTVTASLQDSRGFMWFGTKDGLNRFDGIHFRIFRPQNEMHKTQIISGYITSLCEDHDSCIWVGTTRGICYYDPSTDIFHHLTHVPDEVIRHIAVDHKNHIWFTTANNVFVYDKIKKHVNTFAVQGDFRPNIISIAADSSVWMVSMSGFVFQYSESTQTFNSYSITTAEENHETLTLRKMIHSKRRGYIIATIRNGIRLFDPVTKQTKVLFTTNKEGNSLVIRDIWMANNGELWVGTDTGLYTYSFSKGLSTPIQNTGVDPYSLTDNGIRTICEDKEGGMWFGTFYGGINYLSINHASFDKYISSPLPGRHIQGNVVRAICSDKNGQIYIGSEDQGISWLNPLNQVCTHSNFTYNTQALLAYNDQIWIGTYTDGLFMMDVKTKAIRPLFRSQLHKTSIITLLKTRDEKVYMGTTRGVYCYTPHTKQLVYMEELANGRFIHYVYEDSKGRIWVGSYSDGVFGYDPSSNQVIHYIHRSDNSESLSSNYITTIFESSTGQLWVGTEGSGLCLLNRDDTFSNYSLKEGFPSGIISSICEDTQGYLWISSTGGLVKFDPRAKTVSVYRKEDGLIDNHFSYNSVYKDQTGKIYMGSLRGLIAFYPAEIYPNTYNPTVYITGFYTTHDEQSISEPGKSILTTRKITLAYNNASFRVEFIAPHFTYPNRSSYRFILEGYDTNWSYLTTIRNIYYTNVLPGHYLLKVARQHTEGTWSQEAHIVIDIPPHILLSTWAYCSYGVISAILLCMLFRAYKQHKASKDQALIRELESQKEKEIYTSQINFFTSITHEIRTPLTLIKIPLEKIIKFEGFSRIVSDNLDIIEKNVHRLLALTNQLLDLRRTEMNMQQTMFVRTDICALLNETIERFQPLVQEQNIHMTYHTQVDTYPVVIDREMIIKILSNLLTNALKYTHNTIDIYLELPSEAEATSMLGIRFNSNGTRIPEQYVEKIFTPFFKLNMEPNITIGKGIGIGLSLSRSLAELHQGKLYLDTNELLLNSFVLKLPLNNKEVISKPQSIVEKWMKIDKQGKDNTFQQSLLIVDDEKELAQYLAAELSTQYNTFAAYSGKEAIEVLQEHSINLIISDVIMPTMDGYELCNYIKSTVAYSHIPIILLTAAVGLQLRITGLESGADGYIEKPFELNLLKSQISNIFKNRELACKNFVRSPISNYKSLTINSTDEQFMKKLHAIILERLVDPMLSVEVLANLMNMSTSTLYRKLKSIVNLGPNEYIRLYRLKKAAEMLCQREHKINEISYLTGFSSPSYFTTSFQKQFNISPSDFIKQKKQH